ncbi:MAG TPA: 30S ribosomal protein S8 [Gammaproteobacteria bacterium]|jgi:small subunit ribosomal protein S8
MSMTDPISDMLTRIRNGQKARKVSVTMPASTAKLAIAKVLEAEGYLAGVATEDSGVKRTMTITLKYHHGRPVIERLERTSRPGLRFYSRSGRLPKVQGGLGVAIVSTSKGVMTDRQARAQGHGGEVLCLVC